MFQFPTRRCREDDYIFYLHSFLSRNKEKTENDFLIESINFNKYRIDELENETKEYLRKKFIEENKVGIKKDGFKEFIEYLVDNNIARNKEDIDRSKGLIFDFEIRLNRLPKTIKKTESLLLQGKSLNLSERYEIARSTLDIDNKIRTLNISDTEKYKLLGYILGCNSTNARHIMNGKYQGKIREDILEEYLKTLNS